MIDYDELNKAIRELEEILGDYDAIESDLILRQLSVKRAERQKKLAADEFVRLQIQKARGL